jgi:small subunit ribosomal protein S21
MTEIKITEKTPLEKAMKILKKKLVKEGLFKELKSRRYYEKPSDKKRRKAKEAERELARKKSKKRRKSFSRKKN